MALHHCRRSWYWRRRVALTLVAGLLLVGGSEAGAAGNLRDPFTFGPRHDAPITSGAPMLVGIMWDTSDPLAVVGSEMVGVGDEVWGWRIVEIRTDSVVVEHAGRREIIRPGRALPTP